MDRPDKYKALKAEITAIYHENKGRYGYRRITRDGSHSAPAPG
ncbi:transposase [bacterium 1xD42-67]|nr:transposase [bacterium 1xD42-67]